MLLALEAARRRQHAALAELERALLGELDSARFLRLLVDSATRLFEAHMSVWLVTEEGALVQRITSVPGTYPVGRVTLGEGVTGRCAQERRGFLVPDYPSWPHALQRYVDADLRHAMAHPLVTGDELLGVIAMSRAGTDLPGLPEPEEPRLAARRLRWLQAGVRACLGMPLVARGRTVGVLGIGFGRPRSFTEHEITVGQAFADQAALALENARLYQEAERRRRPRAARRACGHRHPQRAVLRRGADHGQPAAGPVVAIARGAGSGAASPRPRAARRGWPGADCGEDQPPDAAAYPADRRLGDAPGRQSRHG